MPLILPTRRLAEPPTIQPKTAHDADASTAKGLTFKKPLIIDDEASTAPFKTTNPGDAIISKSSATYKEAPVKFKPETPLNKSMIFINSPPAQCLEAPVKLGVEIPELDASILAVRKCINNVFLHADLYPQEAPITFFTELQLAVDAMGAEVQRIMTAITDPGNLETESQIVDAELLLDEVVMSYSSILEAFMEYTQVSGRGRPVR